MIRYIFILLFLSANLTLAQTKEELIEAITTKNELEFGCVGYGCQEGKNYTRFKKLKKLLSTEEFEKLATHKNPVLRMYVLDEFIKNNKELALDILKSEMKRKDSVLIYRGCMGRIEPTSEFIYKSYMNGVIFNKLKEADINDGVMLDSIIRKALASDVMAVKLDSLLLYSKEKLSYLMYLELFDNKTFSNTFLPRIETLAFQENNVFAFEYLLEAHPEAYEKKCRNYIINTFPKTRYLTEDELSHFTGFIEFLLRSNDPIFKDIILTKLRNETFWKKRSAYVRSILNSFNLRL